jgi:uncharacterized membrane protein YphA (DoxX/SURF4 family)
MIDPGWDLEVLFWWATGLSMAGLIGTVIGVPWVLARLPQDYFSQPQRAVWRENAEQPPFALVLGALKNVLGGLLVLLGLLMLFTPGQGLVTLLVGLLLMNFPGKYQLERWLVGRPGVLAALNWLRRKGGHTPFDPPAY